MANAADIPSLISNVNQIGAAKSALANAATNQAIALANAIAVPLVPTGNIAVNLPTAPTLPDGNVLMNNVTTQFNSLRAQLLGEMIPQFTNFFATYFPIGQELQHAIAWVDNAIVAGGSGIDIAVEGALWDRNRARILREAGRAQDELLTTWAARRYALPPGAASYAAMQINMDASGKIADVSRDVAIEAFKAELENIRFAVTTAVSYRTAAMNAASEYIKMLVLNTQFSLQYATQLTETQIKLAEMVEQLYKTNAEVQNISVQAQATVADISLKSADLTLRGNVEKVTLAVQAAMAAAQQAGNQAAAALNAVHAQVGWNLTDSRDLTGTF